MESVYGRKRLGANAGVDETWMDRFTELEPEGGFLAVARQAWNGSARAPQGAGLLNSLNGHMAMKPVYGKKGLSIEAGVSESWMDQYTELEPEGGFRAIVELAWNWTAASSDRHLTALAA